MGRIFYHTGNNKVIGDSNDMVHFEYEPVGDAIFEYSFNINDDLKNLISDYSPKYDLSNAGALTLTYDTNRLGTLSGATKATSNNPVSLAKQTQPITDVIFSNSAYSFAVWYKWYDISVIDTLVAFVFYEDTTQFNSLRVEVGTDLNNNNKLSFGNAGYGVSGEVITYQSDSGLTQGWHHIAVTNDVSDNKRLYLDGYQVATKNEYWDLFPNISTKTYYLGVPQSNISQYNFYGWNRTLSADDVLTLYNTT